MSWFPLLKSWSTIFALLILKRNLLVPSIVDELSSEALGVLTINSHLWSLIKLNWWLWWTTLTRKSEGWELSPFNVYCLMPVLLFVGRLDSGVFKSFGCFLLGEPVGRKLSFFSIWGVSLVLSSRYLMPLTIFLISSLTFRLVFSGMSSIKPNIWSIPKSFS